MLNFRECMHFIHPVHSTSQRKKTKACEWQLAPGASTGDRKVYHQQIGGLLRLNSGVSPGFPSG